MSPRSRTWLSATLAATAAIGLVGCSSSSTSGSSASGSASGQAPVSNGAAQVKVTLTNDGGDKCTVDHTSAPAGPVTFTVTNVSSTAISEVELQSNLKILGEKENLAPGLPASSFTVTLTGGQYTVYCPGADTQNQTFTVSGTVASTPSSDTQQLLTQGTTSYAAWVVSQMQDMQTAVNTLQEAVNAGNLDQAKQAYVHARTFYEKVESDVDGFVMPGFAADDNKGNLDYLIDMRASNIDDKVGWSGFHAVERDLYQAGAISDQTKTYANDLKSNVDKLVDVSKDLDYKPEDLANGAADLLEEVQSTKISGEEEEFSHVDLSDFAGNIEGAQQAFANLQPGLEKIDPTLTDDVATQFTAVQDALNAYRDPNSPGGYIPWTQENRDKYSKQLSQTVLALQQPLQRIAEKVATAQ